MEFHNRKLFAPAFLPTPFCFAVRRSNAHSPEGTLSIEGKVEGAGGDARIAATRRHRRGPQPTRPPSCSFPLGASTKISFGGDRYLHAYLSHQFTGASGTSLSLVARARQFSSFLVLVGRITSATTLEPKYAAIVQNKDELTIPLGPVHHTHAQGVPGCHRVPVSRAAGVLQGLPVDAAGEHPVWCARDPDQAAAREGAEPGTRQPHEGDQADTGRAVFWRPPLLSGVAAPLVVRRSSNVEHRAPWFGSWLISSFPVLSRFVSLTLPFPFTVWPSPCLSVSTVCLCVNQCVDSTPLHLCTYDCLPLDLSHALDLTSNAFALAQACHKTDLHLTL